MSVIFRVVKIEESLKRTQPGLQSWAMISPSNVENSNMSLSKGVVESGKKAALNVHPNSAEAFYILKGKGRIVAGNLSRDIEADMAIYIGPGVPHSIENTGKEPLSFVAVLSPPLSKNEMEKSPWKFEKQ
ncbi:MAG TPA: cupin domain-containing protein [Patescibacteria group bacterium]|nr:cupin domain-containing protein [Patescibacteria group bacterium]